MFWESLPIVDKINFGLGLIIILLTAIEASRRLVKYFKSKPREDGFEVFVACLVAAASVLGFVVGCHLSTLQESRLTERMSKMRSKPEPRILSDQDVAALKNALKGDSGTYVHIYYPVNNEEAKQYAMQFKNLLEAIKWKVEIAESPFAARLVGLEILCGTEQSGNGMNNLIFALNELHIQSETSPVNKSLRGYFNLNVGTNP